jgi:cytochrome c oxidase subunit 3
MNYADNEEENYAIKVKVRKQLLWFGIASLVMMFAGLTSAYVVTRSDVLWVSINPPQPFFTSTFLIVASSVSMVLAVFLAKRGNKIFNLFQLITLGLGIMFCVQQYKGWMNLHELGMHFSFNKVSEVKGEYGKDYVLVYKGIELAKEGEDFYAVNDMERRNPLTSQIMLESKDASSSFFIMLAGLHVAHVLVGLLVLIISLVKGLLGKYPKNRTIGLETSAYFWHFVDFLWIYLFGFLLYIR